MSLPDPLTLNKTGKNDLRSIGRAAYDKGRRIYGVKQSVWPQGFDDDSYETRRRFIYEATWTFHEQLGVPTAIKPKAYIDWIIWHWCDTRKRREQLVVWKPRRVLVSWIFRALELHDMGLRAGDHLIANETYEDSERHVWRYHYLYTQIQRNKPGWALLDAATKGGKVNKADDVDSKRLESITLPNGGHMRAINSNPSALYGDGVRSIVLEEPHTYLDLNGMVSQASILTMTGDRTTRGHVALVGNTAPKKQWVDMFLQELPYLPGDDEPVPAPHPSTVYRNGRGVRVLDLRYQSDPEKDQAWVDAEKPNIPDWNVEMEKDYHVVSGDPIYPSFSVQKHCPRIMREQSWAHPDPQYSACLEDSYYTLGLDSGTNTRNHAGVLLETRYVHYRDDSEGVSVDDYQTVAVKEFVLTDQNGRPRQSDFFELARYAKSWIMEYVPLTFWEDIDWVADETIRTQSGLRNGESVERLARSALNGGAGFKITPIRNDWDARRDAVNWALLGWIGPDFPRFLINGKDCPFLLEGLKGKYCWRPPTSTTENADQRVPDKGTYSHVANALEYACVRARAFCRGKVRRRSA